MRRLTFADVEARRHTLGESALLFITDRCPVGCAHCSVDSRPDSPRVTDYILFGEILDALCASDFTVVGISGGEPFVERRALTMAVERISTAGKDVVVYTSGFWGTRPECPAWAREVIRRCACVFLSTDAFHQAALADERFVNAAAAIASEGRWMVVQVLDIEAMVERATGLLARALGPRWQEYAEVHPTPPLPYGRATNLFRRVDRRPGAQFTQPCRLVDAPVIRYDGRVSACCNEVVTMGAGPAGLRRACRTADEVTAAIGQFRTMPLLRAIGATGPGPLTAHPSLADLADEPAASICEVCWRMVDRLEGNGSGDRIFDALATLGGNR